MKLYTWNCRRRRLNYIEALRRQTGTVSLRVLALQQSIEDLTPETPQQSAYALLRPDLGNIQWNNLHDELPVQRPKVPISTPFSDAMRDVGRKRSQNHFLSRILLAGVAARKGLDPAGSQDTGRPWFPIFWSLTLDPSRILRDVSAFKGKPWQSWIKHINRMGARYVAVIEKPQTNPHMHVLTWHPDLPEDWLRDPGYRRREITAAKATWQYGWSSPRPMRTDTRDAWATRAGHVWPVVLKGNQVESLAQGGIRGMAAYLGKYLAKEITGGPNRWRMTRGLGTEPLTAWLTELTNGPSDPTPKGLKERHRWPTNSSISSLTRRTSSVRTRLRRIDACGKSSLLMRVSDLPSRRGRVLPKRIFESSSEVTPDEMLSMLFAWLGKFGGADLSDDLLADLVRRFDADWEPHDVPVRARGTPTRALQP